MCPRSSKQRAAAFQCGRRKVLPGNSVKDDMDRAGMAGLQARLQPVDRITLCDVRAKQCRKIKCLGCAGHPVRLVRPEVSQKA